MSAGIKTAIVRIRDEFKSIVGAGFAVSQTHILTCAHVIREALSQTDKTIQEQLREGEVIVSLDFPWLGADLLETKLLIYKPDIDLALLEGKSWPEGTEPMTLVMPEKIDDLRNHPFRAFGFPEGYEKGIFADGRIVDGLPGDWLQIEGVSVPGYRVRPGFSGGPVWDETLAGVVGLIAQAVREEEAQAKAAFALSTQLLVREIETLPYDILRTPQEIAHRQYHQKIINKLTDEQLDLQNKFVRLTLVIDHGLDNPTGRFETSTRAADEFEDLNLLLQQQEHQALVLLGGPGSGKTVLLQRLQLDTAQAALKADNVPYPFFVRLSRYREGAAEPYDWLKAEWQRDNPGLPAFSELLRDGRFLFLFDGLNEMPPGADDGYRELVGRWSHFLDQHLRGTGCRALFTCRTLDYSAQLGVGYDVTVQRVQVNPLDQAKIVAFLQIYLSDEAVVQKIWEQIQGDAYQEQLFGAPFFLKLLVELDSVQASGAIPQARAELLTRFVRQSLAKEIDRPNKHFTSGSILTSQEVRQIGRKQWPRSPYVLPERGPLIPGLVVLAYNMQAGQEYEERRQVTLPLFEAEELIAHDLAEDILKAGQQLNLLDEEEGQEAIECRFRHQLFQEYFAARQLARQPEPERVEVIYRSDQLTEPIEQTLAGLKKGEELPLLKTSGWEETMVLAVEMSRDPETLVRDLIAVNLPLAARCALLPHLEISAVLIQDVRQALLDRITDDSVDLRARILAAEALGEIGDSRFTHHTGIEGDYLLPPFVPVPPGRYRLGDDDGLYEDEKPAHEVTLAGFEIAVYPVTNAEFDLFILGGGYEDERWWDTDAAKGWHSGETTAELRKMSYREDYKLLKSVTESQIRDLTAVEEDIEFWLQMSRWSEAQLEAWLERNFQSGLTYRQPAFSQDVRFNRPNQPVVGVSWYEARAYCNWLSATSGQSISLPTEAEWEAAARRDRSWAYAYGPEFDPSKANTAEAHLLRTSPVGVFIGGQTPEGIYDLSGNVWEWTNTIWGENINQHSYDYPYDAHDGREDAWAPPQARRVTRGGSWTNVRYNARVAYRDRYLQENRDFFNGFRVVRRPSS